MNARSYAALLAACLTSTAAMAQESSDMAYGLTVGPAFFSLPDIDTGVVSSAPGSLSLQAGGFGLGANLGLSGGMSIGTVGNFSAAIGLSGFATIGRSSATAVDRFTGPGVVVIGGYTTPGNATIDLTTASAPGNSSGSAVIAHTNPQGGVDNIGVTNTIAAPGAANIYAASIAGGANSFAFAGVVTQQGALNSAAAYGAVAATDGGVFFGAGDLTGLVVKTNVTRDVIYTGADLSMAMSTNTGSIAIQGYAGPSYRLLDQSSKTTVSVDIPEAPTITPSTFPTYSMIRDEDLVSHYFGGIVGLNISKPISDTLLFSLGVEGGVYYVRDNYQGGESYSIAGGSGPVVPLTTVTNANRIDFDADGVAWSAKLAPSVTVALASNRQLTIGGTIDYLSRVATVSRDGSVATATNTYAGTDDGTLHYGAPSQTSNTLSFAPMWNFTPTISFTGQF